MYTSNENNFKFSTYRPHNDDPEILTGSCTNQGKYNYLHSYIEGNREQSCNIGPYIPLDIGIFFHGYTSRHWHIFYRILDLDLEKDKKTQLLTFIIFPPVLLKIASVNVTVAILTESSIYEITQANTDIGILRII